MRLRRSKLAEERLHKGMLSAPARQIPPLSEDRFEEIFKVHSRLSDARRSSPCSSPLYFRASSTKAIANAEMERFLPMRYAVAAHQRRLASQRKTTLTLIEMLIYP
jgi:hypothetical protein